MSNNYQALLEDTNDKFKTIIEGQTAMAGVPSRLDRIEHRLDSIEITLWALQPAIKNHEGRISKLEAA
jgi:hypothetical protein